MADVQPSTLKMKNCFSSHYSLPYFQREYKWETRHFVEMLDDIQEAFLQDFDAEKGRKAVADYAPYFLGSIITAAPREAKKPLIDGQQRLTSIFLLICFLQKYSQSSGAASMDLKNYIGSLSFGERDYTIEFSNERKSIFDTFLKNETSIEDSLAAISDLDGLNESDHRVANALRSVQGSLNENILKNIEYFVDYVMERVLIIDISVETESEGHRVFVTMNDRGLRLSPIDLLKGQILSRIYDPEDTAKCHALWTNSFSELKKYDPEEDSLFIRTYLRAKWADTTRGKAQGAEAGDFDHIGEAYHRWFDDNLKKMGLVQAEDFNDFVKDDIVKFSGIYKFIKDCEAEPKDGFEHLYYNAIRRFGPQSMILISSIHRSDSTKVWKAKLSLIASFIDILLTSRTVEGKKNNYDNIKDLAFGLTKEFRNKSIEELREIIELDWKPLFSTLDKIPTLQYTYADRSDLLFILARISGFVDVLSSADSKSQFLTYWMRDKGGKTFDIEHILPEKFDDTNAHSTDPFRDATEYSIKRNFIGALILLPRSRNRSLQDKPFKDKVEAYKTENALAKSLTESFYVNNPKVKNYVGDNPDIALAAFEEFGKPEIEARSQLYTAIAKRVWAFPVAVPVPSP